MNFDEIIARLIETMNDIPDDKIYFTLRQFRVKYIKPETVRVVGACLALQAYGLPVTTRLLCALLKLDPMLASGGLAARLHTLGDKKVLILKRPETLYRSGQYEWVVSPQFLQRFKGLSGACQSCTTNIHLSKAQQQQVDLKVAGLR